MKKYLLLILGVFLFSSCDLDEELFDRKTPELFFTDEESFRLASGTAYQSLYGYAGTHSLFGIQEVSSDEMAVPARGGDWFENGHWIRLHQHEYRPNDQTIETSWRFCYGGIATCNEIIENIEKNYIPDADQYLAELKVLRALYYLWLLDLYGNVPIVTTNEVESPENNTRQEVFSFVEDEVLENQDKLTKEINSETYSRMTYYVAQAILVNLYLNAEVYTGAPQWQKAIEACDEIIQSGYFNLATDYFENFSRTNALSPEMILAIPYDEIKAQGFNIHMMTLHYASQATYNLQAQPWNGFCSLQEFYESFDSADARKNSFIVGPQYAKDGTRLEDPGADNQDPDGPPITFTPEINSIGLNTYRQAGARIGKYEVYEGAGQDLDNDFPIFRYGEILLDKAEALWRLDPANSEALMLVNLFRKRANVPEFTQLNAENLLAERGRELAFETKRRTDLIRFGKYGDPWDFKDASDPCKTLFPIPQSQLEAGSNLKQNPCY